MLLLGANVFPKTDDPEELAARIEQKGYRACYWPEQVTLHMADKVADYHKAFAKRSLVIAEVGAWCNPMTKDPQAAKENIAFIQNKLALADAVNARCCVNIIGTYGTETWFSPCADNFTKDFYDHAIQVAREIIDGVKPKRTKMTFEIMPFSFLDGMDNYLNFLYDVDRPQMGVHLDPVNIINSARSYYAFNTRIMRDAIRKAAPYVRSFHIKDMLLRPLAGNVQLQEVVIGQGIVDYPALLREIARVPGDMPVMLEHYKSEADYDQATQEVRRQAQAAGIPL